MKASWILCGLLLSLHVTRAAAIEPCRIRIIDQSNGWPVPLVELETTHHVRFVSDNAGIIAFDLPELMNTPTWFHVRGHGYSVKKDRFGYAGVRLVPKSGETLTIQVRRSLAAKRLGRITGGGLFAESQKLGDEVDWKEQGILGCDSVQNAEHNGLLFWGWGDTVLPSYPLGRFHMIGATTPLQPLASIEPPIRLRYDYISDAKDIPRNVAKMPGEGPTWLGGYVSLADRKGKKHLVATYAKIRPPLTEYEKGLCVWNEQTREFERRKVVWTRTAADRQSPVMPHGHPIFWDDDAGKPWVLFGDPFPTIKCPATFEDWSDPDRWSLVKPQSSVPTRPGSSPDQPAEVTPHRGAIAWSEFLHKWVAVFTQLHGDSSSLGEIWFAESDSPLGPWKDAIKIVTHDSYSFYNPKWHVEFTPKESPTLLFEATYTRTFSKTGSPTPRHDYNQVLYRLDLDDL